jgi:hypothetical protein
MIAMRADMLYRTVRNGFRQSLKRGRRQLAVEDSVRLLKAYRPDWLDSDIRKAVARMLAEEPLAWPAASPSHLD